MAARFPNTKHIIQHEKSADSRHRRARVSHYNIILSFIITGGDAVSIFFTFRISRETDRGRYKEDKYDGIRYGYIAYINTV